jgi:heptose-I-phosphate ethanolaminephosphotransferase
MKISLRANDKNKKFDWVGLGWQYLFFWYFSGVIQLLIKVNKTSVTSGFRDTLLVSALWLILTLLFLKRTQIISIAVGIILWVTSMVALGYFFITGKSYLKALFISHSNPMSLNRVNI